VCLNNASLGQLKINLFNVWTICIDLSVWSVIKKFSRMNGVARYCALNFAGLLTSFSKVTLFWSGYPYLVSDCTQRRLLPTFQYRVDLHSRRPSFQSLDNRILNLRKKTERVSKILRSPTHNIPLIRAWDCDVLHDGSSDQTSGPERWLFVRPGLSTQKSQPRRD
jgi:hypothetical protein